MALRIRRDGRVLCAAMHPAEEGDAPCPTEFGPRGCHDLDDVAAAVAHAARPLQGAGA